MAEQLQQKAVRHAVVGEVVVCWVVWTVRVDWLTPPQKLRLVDPGFQTVAAVVEALSADVGVEVSTLVEDREWGPSPPEPAAVVAEVMQAEVIARPDASNSLVSEYW